MNIDENVTIGDNCVIGDLVIICDNVEIKKDAFVDYSQIVSA